MSNREKIGISIAVIAILALLSLAFFKTPTPKAGSVNLGTRTAITTIDGNTASTSANGITNGVYINPAVAANATSTLITQISDVDNLTFFGSFVASSSPNVQIAVQFQESDYPGCNTNNASTTWYNLIPVTSVTQQVPVLLASTTPFLYTPASSSTPQGFAFKVPFTPAQCIQAKVYAPITTAGNFQIWYGFASQKKGYNNPF